MDSVRKLLCKPLCLIPSNIFFSVCTATFCSSTNSLRLYNPHGSTATQGGMLQICISNRWRAVCDYTFGCSTEGRAACRQLGYSGSQISKLLLVIISCRVDTIPHTCLTHLLFPQSTATSNETHFTISTTRYYVGTWSVLCTHVAYIP